MLVDDILASHLPTSRVPRLHAILLQPGAPVVFCKITAHQDGRCRRFYAQLARQPRRTSSQA